MKGLAGKVAVVTGGGAGIGRATAFALAERGVHVVIAERDVPSGEETARDLADGGATALFVATDCGDEDSIRRMTEEATATLGGVDILVNCAAEFIMRGVDATVDDWQRVTAVNVVGYALCAKYAVPEMRRRGGGAIVNVCSISAFIAQPEFVTYSATKGAVWSMTRCMALDLARDNIRVNAVSPGTTWTESNERFIARTMGLDRGQADRHPDVGGRHMLGRTADPEEVAEAIAFLASQSASFITGENLFVDGGYTAW